MGRREYPSDVSDDEWAILEPLIQPAKPGGRPRTTDIREVINALFSPLPQRHLLVDTNGLILHILVHEANIQDQAGADTSYNCCKAAFRDSNSSGRIVPTTKATLWSGGSETFGPLEKPLHTASYMIINSDL